jgi:hypothetical protein
MAKLTKHPFHVGQCVRVRQSNAAIYESDYDGVVVEVAPRHIIVCRITPIGCLPKRIYNFDFYLVAPLKRADVKVLVAERGDYTHYGFRFGRRRFIAAGCISFDNVSEARTHWKTRQRCNEEYYDEDDSAYRTETAKKARALDKKRNKFSLRFVDKVAKL